MLQLKVDPYPYTYDSSFMCVYVLTLTYCLPTTGATARGRNEHCQVRNAVGLCNRLVGCGGGGGELFHGGATLGL